MGGLPRSAYRTAAERLHCTVLECDVGGVGDLSPVVRGPLCVVDILDVGLKVVLEAHCAFPLARLRMTAVTRLSPYERAPTLVSHF